MPDTRPVFRSAVLPAVETELTVTYLIRSSRSEFDVSEGPVALVVDGRGANLAVDVTGISSTGTSGTIHSDIEPEPMESVASASTISPSCAGTERSPRLRKGRPSEVVVSDSGERRPREQINRQRSSRSWISMDFDIGVRDRPGRRRIESFVGCGGQGDIARQQYVARTQSKAPL